MKLYSAIVSLPEKSHSKHAVIDGKMRKFQGEIIILAELKDDPDYSYSSYHKKTHHLWWWNKEWLRDVRPLSENSHLLSILSFREIDGNGFIENEEERNALASTLAFLSERYMYQFDTTLNPLEILKQVKEREDIVLSPLLVRKAIKLYGYKSNKVKKG